MRCFKGGLAALGLAWASAGAAETTLESRVLAAVNAARADPAAAAQSLGGLRRSYRSDFRYDYYTLPGRAERMLTQEGVGAVNEAIGFLARQEREAPVEDGPLLARAAADHVAEQRASGRVGHADPDGEGPADRLRRHGGGDEVAEVITYGAADAADVVRQLIVDDGVPERDHRAILFDPRLRYAGVSCGPHPVYRTMCVIDFAMTRDGTADDVAERNPIRYGR